MVVPANYLDDHTVYHLQPSGKFVIGGPQVSERGGEGGEGRGGEGGGGRGMAGVCVDE